MRDELRRLHELAGSPTKDRLKEHADGTGHSVSRAALAAVTMNTGSAPRWATVEAFIDACVSYASARRRPLPNHEIDMLAWKTRYDRTYPGQRKNRTSNVVSIGVVPSLAGCFQPRGLIDELAQATRGGGTAVLFGSAEGTTRLLSGMAGVGKTQLAVHLVHQLRETGQLDVLVWVHATSRQAITASYGQAAVDLTIPGASGTDAERDAARFHAWLANSNRRWLVVLDDLITPAAAKGLWPPPSSNGRTVVTTRLRGSALTGQGRCLVPVGVFTHTEAIAYLHARLDDHPELADDIDGLAVALQHLPLALSHATAYMIDEQVSCKDYKRRLSDHRHRLDDLAPTSEDLPDDYFHTVAATVFLSTQAADKLRPTHLALPLLQLASMLDGGGFPVSILATTAAINWLSCARAYSSHENDNFDLGETEFETIRSGVRSLHRLNLVNIEADSVTIHSLVQRAIREQLTDDKVAECAWAAADALLETWPNPELDPTYAQMLQANAASICENGNDALFTSGAHQVLFRRSDSLYTFQGAVPAAAAYHQLFEHCRRILGHDHPDTLKTHGLFLHCRGSSDPAFAAQALEQLVAEFPRILGPDHLDTLGIRNLLAYWQGSAGDPAGAVRTLEPLLADFLRLLGPDHPDTLTTRVNLAKWRGEAGNPAVAVADYEQLVADRARVLGSDHPNTLDTRSQLAWWRGVAGNPAGAVVDYEQLLVDRIRVLGSNHPNTLTTRSDLANWRGKAGNPADAVALHEKLLADCERLLGADHHDTLTTRSDLATWRGRLGDPAGAAVDYEELVTDSRQILGDDHVTTLLLRGSLAHWRGEAGDPTGAVALYERLLADYRRVLGPGHPKTLTVRGNFAHWRGKAGDPTGAVALYEQVLADCSSLLGTEHGDTLTIRSRLANWRGKSGDPAGAVVAFKQLLVDQERVLGPDHPDVVDTRDKVAYWHADTSTGDDI
ncbi:hypothetical protein GCM10017567_73370 [Amycolatopsis bullii]|uniref:NB-ARC domain-containing protein n=2 Tax=Pseudonocardiaceae TaxID=2070 RepID=A0ABQ3KNG9_9PSEU|nr:hypothetical protein GCM10017567_73370 [Amycolatopsis bullii]